MGPAWVAGCLLAVVARAAESDAIRWLMDETPPAVEVRGVSHSAGIEKMADKLTGDIVVRMHRGTATTIKRRSENSLFSQEFATFSADEVYNQQHAEGFIRLYSLPSRIAAMKANQPQGASH